MSFSFTFTLDIGDKKVNIRELSFIEYKNICKQLFNQTDVTKIKKVFNDILNTCVLNKVTLNIYEKIVTLLFIRGLTLGKDVSLQLENKKITFNTDLLLQKLSNDTKPFDVHHNNLVYKVGLPYNFILSENDIIKGVCESLISIDTGEKMIYLSSLNDEEKLQVISFLPGLPITEIYKKIYNNYKDISFNIPNIENINFDLFNASFIFFLKFIFDENFNTVLSLEYNLRRHLNFNMYDLEKTSYPEAKIMLNKFSDEMKESLKNNSSGNINLPQ